MAESVVAPDQGGPGPEWVRVARDHGWMPIGVPRDQDG